MVAGFAQYSPQQVLEAGRRAEADGKHDYAVQFYSYVATQHANTAEAVEAADALRRLEILEPDNRGVMPASQAQPPYAGGPTQYAPANSQNNAGMAAQLPYAVPATAPTARAQVPAASAPPNGNRRLAAEPGLTTGPPAKSRRRQAPRENVAPVAANSYRVGRLIAALLGFAGWIGIIAGLVELGSSLVLTVTKTPNILLTVLSAPPSVAVGVLAASCIVILLSQMARATFDAAARRPAGHDDDGDD